MNRIKELREKKNLSQKDFVIDLNHFLDTYLDKYKKQRGVKRITFGTASRWENSLNQPTEAMWQVLADYFNVSVPYLKGKIFKEDLDDEAQDMFEDVQDYISYVVPNELVEPILQALLNSYEYNYESDGWK